MRVKLRILALISLNLMVLSDSSESSEIVVNDAASSNLKSNVIFEADNVNSKDTPRSTEKQIPQSLKDAKNCEELYAGGVRSYSSQLWYSCASKLERAINGYKLHQRILSDCRLECKRNPQQSKLSNLTFPTPDFEIFGTFLKGSDCFRRCADESFGSTYVPISTWVVEAFQERTAYDYVQFCYHKLDQPKKAASAAYTYFLKHPDDESSKKNIVYYRDTARIAESDFLDLEMVPYKEHYIRATVAYSSGDWEDVISHMEQSLEEYFLEYERCELDCEGKSSTSDTELTTGVADWMLFIMNCRSLCEKELSKVFTVPIENFVRDIYSYLQYSYSSVGNFDKAVQAAANFLAFDADHESMLKNKNILITREGYKEEDFIPQKEVLEYIHKKSDLDALMLSIVDLYRHKEPVLERPEEKEVPEQDRDLFNDIGDLHEVLDDIEDDWMEVYEQLGMNVIARSVDLNRAERFVTDGILRPEQCDELLTLTKDLPTVPQGSQIFTLRLAQQKLEEDLSEESEATLRLYARSAEVVRHYTQRYLNPDMSYFFKKTSIVCWPPSEDSKTCYPQEDGTCVKFDEMSDELFNDLFTTVTYLHTADEDSDFSFLNEDKGTDRSFGLKCGRTVGFNTGDRHSLNIPKSGSKRCAMVLRYTLNHNEDDKEYSDLITMLNRIEELRMATADQKPEAVLKKFADSGVKVTKEGKQLKAKERVVADGLASDAQCSTLQNMVVTLGKPGDGYKGKTSPHTYYELFSGLGLKHVNQNGALVGDGYDHLKQKPSEVSPHTENELYRGMTMYRAGKLAYDEKISLGALKDFLDLSENSRLFTEKYFNLTKPLYFDFTHLVCRTAVDGSNFDREDLSHPVHADNCNLHPNGTCSREFPSFFHRDYSAILYLNNDFEGGEFFFAHGNKSEQVSVRPKCGRLVAFNAGHFHGVKAVKKGQRCALALWFTHQAMFKELAHVQSRKILKDKDVELKSRVKLTHEDL